MISFYFVYDKQKLTGQQHTEALQNWKVFENDGSNISLTSGLKLTLLVHYLDLMLPLDHKRTASPLVPPIFYVAEKSAIKRQKDPISC